MVSSPNKISKKETIKPKAPTFERSLAYSALFHLALTLTLLGFNHFDVSIWKKPPRISSVVWSQTVKRPKPTIPDKLPPPMVPIQKQEAPKKEEINIKKQPVPEKPKEDKESAKDKMKKALEALKKNIKDDDRPVPKADNFPDADPKKPDGVMSDSEILALEASPAYSAYIATIKEVVKNNFIWYKTADNFSSTILLRIDLEGKVLNSKVEISSGDFSYDQAVLRAIQQSNPLPPPPNPELAKLFFQEGFEFKFERKIQ